MDSTHLSASIMASTNTQVILTNFEHWYALFWTVNGVALAWMYKWIYKGRIKCDTRLTISIAFILLNITALVFCLVCYMETIALHTGAGQSAGALYSILFLRGVFILAAFTIIVNLAAWIALPISVSQQGSSTCTSPPSTLSPSAPSPPASPPPAS